MVLVRRVVAEDIHIEAGALLDQRQADSSGADHRDGLAGYLVTEERKIGMPRAPLVFANKVLAGPQFAGESSQDKEGKLGRGFSENVGCVGERDLVAVGIGAVDVVEADGNLGDDLELSLPCFKNLGIDLVAKSGDEAVDSALCFFYDERFGRGFRAWVDLNIVSALAQHLDRVADVAGRKDALRAHC